MALKIGQKVRVNIKPTETTADSVMKYNGEVHKIRSLVTQGSRGAYATLEGCVSDYGVPFAFHADWLLEMAESEGEE